MTHGVQYIMLFVEPLLTPMERQPQITAHRVRLSVRQSIGSLQHSTPAMLDTSIYKRGTSIKHRHIMCVDVFRLHYVDLCM